MDLSVFGAVACLVALVPMTALFVVSLLPSKKGSSDEEDAEAIRRRAAFARMAGDFDDGFMQN